MSVLEQVGYALDTPGALLRGALSGKPGTRATGRELLGLGKNKPGLDAEDVIGFLAEMLVDPLNLVGGAALAKGGKMASKALKTRKAAGVLDKATDVVKPVGSASGMASKAEHVDEGAGVIRSLAAKRLQDTRKGVDWVGGHYRDKLKKTPRVSVPATHPSKNAPSLLPDAHGNVVNPRSGLRLWDDPVKGQRSLERVASGRQIVTDNPTYPMQFPDMDVAGHFDAGVSQDPMTGAITRLYEPEIAITKAKPTSTVGDEIRSIGSHEGMHAINEIDNIHPDTLSHLQRAVSVAKKEDNIRKGSKYPAMNFGARKAAGKKKLLPRARDGFWDDIEYVRKPTETMANVAEVRRGMQKAGVDHLPHSPRVVAHPYEKTMQQTPRLVLDPNMGQGAINSARRLEAAYGPRLLNHLLRVLPAVAPIGAAPLLFNDQRRQG